MLTALGREMTAWTVDDIDSQMRFVGHLEIVADILESIGEVDVSQLVTIVLGETAGRQQRFSTVERGDEVRA